MPTDSRCSSRGVDAVADRRHQTLEKPRHPDDAAEFLDPLVRGDAGAIAAGVRASYDILGDRIQDEWLAPPPAGS